MAALSLQECSPKWTLTPAVWRRVRECAVTVTVCITRITSKIITNGLNCWRPSKSALPHSVHLAHQPKGTAPVHYGKSIEKVRAFFCSEHLQMTSCLRRFQKLTYPWDQNSKRCVSSMMIWILCTRYSLYYIYILFAIFKKRLRCLTLI